MLHWRRRSAIILDRTNTRIKIENLPQRHVKRANAATNGRSQRPLNRNAKFPHRRNRVVGQPVVEFSLGFLPGEDFEPGHAPLAQISFFDRGIEHAHRCLPDVASRAVTLDERNNRVRGNVVFPASVADRLAIRRNCNAVIRSRHIGILRCAVANPQL